MGPKKRATVGLDDSGEGFGSWSAGAGQALAEMEHGEARLPPQERFDVGELRRELGLPEA